MLRFRHAFPAFPARFMSLEAILASSKAIVGMVHLEPLPGSPRWAGSMKEVTRAALADAHALAEGGVDAILVENFGDVPFSPGRVDPACVAAMAAVATEIRGAVSLPLGINALRSDAVRPRHCYRSRRTFHPRERTHGRRGQRPGHPRLRRARDASLSPPPRCLGRPLCRRADQARGTPCRRG